MAATLRDIASVLLVQENEITSCNAANYIATNGEYEGEMAYINNQSRNNWVGPASVLASGTKVQQYWFVFRTFFRLQRQALGLYNTDNTFRTYTVQKDSNGKVSNVLFNQTPDGDAFFGHVSNEMRDAFFAKWNYDMGYYTCWKYSNYSMAQYVLNIWKRGDGMTGWTSSPGIHGRAASINAPVFEDGTYPALGLGVIEPGSIVASIGDTDEITITKIIAGTLDKTAKWDFKLSVPESDYNSVCNASIGVTITKADGTPISFSSEGGKKVYSFQLGNNESLRLKVNIPNADSKDLVREKLVWTVEEIDAKDLLTANADVEDEKEKFRLFINGNEKSDNGIIDGVQLGTTTVYKNLKGDDDTPKGKLHVIVDYNLPSAYASSDPGEPNDLTNDNVLDCGVHSAGEVVELALVANGTALSSPGVEVPGIADKVHFKFKDLSLKPDGVSYEIGSNDGKILGSDGNVYRYQLPTNVGDEEKLLILYVLWDITVDDVPPPPPDIPDPTPDPTTNVYTVYWDLGAGFDGGGITSQTCGQIVIPALDLSVSSSCGCGGGPTAHAQRKAIKIDFGFDLPGIPHMKSAYRIGCYFVGWLPEDPAYSEYNYIDYVSQARSGVKTYIDVQNEVVSGKIPINGKDWLPYIKDNPETPGKSMTYHAIWVGEQYSFDANGGYYPTEDDRKHEGVTYEGVPMESTENDAKKLLLGYPDYKEDCFGNFTHNDRSPRDHRLKFATVHQSIQNHNAYWVPRIEPVRTGYTFTGWYWDPGCTTPVTRNEEGFIPNRTYFAGWDAEPVYVRYHDTREGNSVVTTQVYKYDDMI